MHKIFISALLSLGTIIPAMAQNKVDTINLYDESGKKTGKWVRTWMETGKVASVEFYMAGKKNGLCKYYRQDGDLENEIEYKNDTLHGTYKFYAYTGQKEVSTFRHGRKEDTTRIYNYKWQLVEDYAMKNGIMNGIHRYYHKSGRVMAEGYYIDGRETGTRHVYRDNDKKEVEIEIDYIEGRRQERRFYKKNKLIKIEKFDQTEERKQLTEDVL